MQWKIKWKRKRLQQRKENLLFVFVFLCLHKKKNRPEKFIHKLNVIRQQYLCVPKYNYCLLLKNNFPQAVCTKEKSINIRNKSLTSLHFYMDKKSIFSFLLFQNRPEQSKFTATNEICNATVEESDFTHYGQGPPYPSHNKDNK